MITGDSGAGKTTLLQLLAGVQRPESGQVLVAGGPGDLDLADVDPDAWRARLAWAGQGAAMQAGSIRDNLALGNPSADDATLRSALESVDAAGFVDQLPDGWHTVLGEGGAGISQGQRQRLALARALARPASVLLLDEPTAALDEQTEQRVLAGIAAAARGRTVVLVTHRLAPIALADSVIALRSGDDPPPAEAAAGRGRAGRRPVGREPAADGGRPMVTALRARHAGAAGNVRWPRATASAPLWRLWGQARGVRGRLLGAAVLGALASGCAVGLMATSAWLIARAAQQPPVLYLMVAIVAVRTFGIGRGVLRYLERLVSHDAAFRVLGQIRQKLVAHLARDRAGRPAAVAQGRPAGPHRR